MIALYNVVHFKVLRKSEILGENRELIEIDWSFLDPNWLLVLWFIAVI